MRNQSILSILSLSDVGLCLTNGPIFKQFRSCQFTPGKSTHWFAYIYQICFNSCGCSRPQKLPRFIIKRKWLCLYSENKIQGLDSYSADFCLDISYLTKVSGIDFKSAVLNSRNQSSSLHKWHYEKQQVKTVQDTSAKITTRTAN